jgi:hypothetical protein
VKLLRLVLLIVATACLFPATARAQTNFSALAYPGQTGRVLYKPDALGNRLPDFSRVGYRGGDAPLPDVAFVIESNRWVFVSPGPGDDQAAIQAAIDQVEAMSTNALGFRGVVQLSAGIFEISNQLTIRSNGVVLRGLGDGTDTNSSTILRSTSTNQVSLIDVDSGAGSRSTVASTTHNITDKFVPVGATSFRVDSTNNWQPGHRIIVRRPSTTNWIQDLGMDMIPQNSDSNVVQWAAGNFDQLYERFITRLEGNRVFLDAPLPNSFEQQYGGGTVYRYTFNQRLTRVGIENLRGESAFASATDENHAWSFIDLDRVEDCWVRNITARYFGFSAVVLSTSASRVTVTDAQCLDPKSVITGGRRYAFNNQGQLNLMRDLFSQFGRHDFVNNSPARGPNVFFNGVATNMFSEAGPHQRWSAGTLYDNLDCYGEALAGYNRGNFGTGHGWSGANMIFWNCRANTMRVENPFTAQNWVIGCVGTIQDPNDFLGAPIGTYDSHGTNVSLGDPVGNPSDSLYLAQLNQRLANRALQGREYVVGDFDAYTYDGTNSVDNGGVDPAWLTAVQGIIGSNGTNQLDQTNSDAFTPFTFNFQLASGERVDHAVLTLAMRRTGGRTRNDSLWLDHPTNRLTFTNLGLGDVELPNSGSGFLIYEFTANQLTNLQDGRLNGLIGEDSVLDWAILSLQVATAAQPVVTTLEPVADAFVRDGSFAASNAGSSTILTVKQDNSPDFRRESLLRFSLTNVAGNVIDARLRLYCSSVSDPVMNAIAFVADDTWTEGGIAWTNAPPAGGAFASWSPLAGQFIEVPVTSFIQEAVAGDDAVSFRIFSQSLTTNGFVNYNSREASLTNRPQLVVTVSNSPPTISTLANRSVAEDTGTGAINFTIGDVESPVGALALDGASSNPALVPGANILFGGSASNRTVSLLPATNASGAATITVTVTDPQGLTNARAFTLTVNPINDPPELAAVSNRMLNAGQTLLLTNAATDPEVPPQSLIFSLLSFPTGATLNATSGVFSWRPAVAQAGTTNLIRLRVTDNGTNTLSATQSFTAFVNPLAAPAVAATTGSNGEVQLLVSGDAGPDYTVQASTNLTNWTVLLTTNSPVTPFPWVDTNAGSFLRRFYRVLLGP